MISEYHQLQRLSREPTHDLCYRPWIGADAAVARRKGVDAIAPVRGHDRISEGGIGGAEPDMLATALAKHVETLFGVVESLCQPVHAAYTCVARSPDALSDFAKSHPVRNEFQQNLVFQMCPWATKMIFHAGRCRIIRGLCQGTMQHGELLCCRRGIAARPSRCSLRLTHGSHLLWIVSSV